MNKSRLMGAMYACVIWLAASNPSWASPVDFTSHNLVISAFDSGFDQGDTNYGNDYGTTFDVSDDLSATASKSENTTSMSYLGDADSATFPLPAAVWLFGAVLVLLGLVGMARHKKA